ncbi:MAG TPA: hypothetical protein VG847_02660 [Chitinophagaceae bacterium]|nr:hypothetical protein [Chitinophagaceae bacterium]
MGFFSQIEGRNTKWLWFSLTILCSFIPCIARAIAATNLDISYFDTKDLIFAGIAINLSNFSLISSHIKFELKTLLSVFSTLANLFLAVILGILLSDDNNKNAHSTMWLSIFCIIIVGFSVYLSYDANDYIIKKELS